MPCYVCDLHYLKKTLSVRRPESLGYIRCIVVIYKQSIDGWKIRPVRTVAVCDSKNMRKGHWYVCMLTIVYMSSCMFPIQHYSLCIKDFLIICEVSSNEKREVQTHNERKECTEEEPANTIISCRSHSMVLPFGEGNDLLLKIAVGIPLTYPNPHLPPTQPMR